MDLSLLILSVFVALIAVMGWFIDRVLTLAWLRRYLVPRVDVGLKALDNLRLNPKLGIEKNDPAFKVLSDIWPKFPIELPVQAIGRTMAYVQFGSEVTNEIGLTLFGEGLNRIEGHDWTISKANDALINPLKKRFHCFGTILFFLGVAITLVAAGS